MTPDTRQLINSFIRPYTTNEQLALTASQERLYAIHALEIGRQDWADQSNAIADAAEAELKSRGGA